MSSKPSRIEDYEIFNNDDEALYIHVYDKDEPVVPADDSPIRTWMVPIEGGMNIADINIHFDYGIYVRATKSIDPTVATDPDALTLVVNIGYKHL